MSDLEWLRSYVGANVSLNEKPCEGEDGAKPSKVPRKNNRKSKKKDGEPWLPGFPDSDDVVYATAQFFDNGEKPGKGKAEHVLKLRVHTGDPETMDEKKPDWWRCAHMLEQAAVMDWAAEQHMNGRMTNSEFDHYSDALRDLSHWKLVNPSGWAKVGHIASSPGKHYFSGQFVILRAGPDRMDVFVHVHGQEPLHITMRENTRSKNGKAPVAYGHYDPQGLRSGEDDEE